MVSLGSVVKAPLRVSCSAGFCVEVVVKPRIRVAGRRQDVTTKSQGSKDHVLRVGNPNVGRSVVVAGCGRLSELDQAAFSC